MTALDRSIEAFARAHAAELTSAEVFTLGEAAGIISRVHAPTVEVLSEQRAALVEIARRLDDEHRT